MLARLRSSLTYANVMVTILAFIVLSGGTAVALDGTNTVFTDDIVDGEVRNADIGANQVTATRLAPESVETSEIKQSNVFNADIAGNTITSGRIADETLADLDIGADSVGSSELKPNAVGASEVANESLSSFDVGGWRQSETGLFDSTDDGTAETGELDEGGFADVGFYTVNATCNRAGTAVTGAVTIENSEDAWDVDSTAPGGQNSQTAVPAGETRTLISVTSSTTRAVQTGTFAALGELRLNGTVAVSVRPPQAPANTAVCSFGYGRFGG